MEEKFKKFNDNYTEKLKKYYSKYSVKKRNILIKFIISLLMLEIIYFLFSIILFYNFEKICVSIFLCTIITIIAFTFGIIKIFKKEKIYLIDNIISDIVKYISNDDKSIFDPSRMICTESIEKMELFDLKKLEYTGRNVIQANYKNNPMSFSDITISFLKEIEREEEYFDEEGNKKTKKVKDKVRKNIFNGCYISANLNKKIPEHIYLIPNNLSDLILNGKIRDYITYDGEEIKLENLEISEKYKVYSNDEIQARYVLSINLMEKIINLDKCFENKKYIVFKEDGRFVICIQGLLIQELRTSYIPSNLNSNKIEESLHYLFKNIYNLFDIYNVLDLGNDIFIDNNQKR